jgi:hygromycin-B 7''-O-kinase
VLHSFNLPATYQDFAAKWKDTEFWKPTAIGLLSHLGLPATALERPSRGSNIVFKTGDLFLKMFPPFQLDQYQSEIIGLNALSKNLPVEIPSLLQHGEMGDGWNYAIISALNGVVVEEVWPEFSYEEKMRFMAALGGLVREVQHLDVPTFQHRDASWPEFIDRQHAQVVARQSRVGMPQHLLSDVGDYVAKHVAYVREPSSYVLLTGEYTPENLMAAKTADGWKLSGMFDFGDLMTGHPEYDLLGPTMFYSPGDPHLQQAFFNAFYNTECEISDEARHRLMTLALLHLFSDFMEQLVMEKWQEAKSLEGLAIKIWP